MTPISVFVALACWTLVVFAAPAESGLESREDCWKMEDLTSEWFFKESLAEEQDGRYLEPAQCLFYTAGLTNRARELALKTSMVPIWDLWDRRFFNIKSSLNDPNSPLRCIIDDGRKEEYFERMSRAFAEMCTFVATLITPDPNNVARDGIWARIERPTLERNDRLDPPRGKTDFIEACDRNLQNGDYIFRRPGTNPAEKFAAGYLLAVIRSGAPQRRTFEKDDEPWYTDVDLEALLGDINW